MVLKACVLFAMLVSVSVLVKENAPFTTVPIKPGSGGSESSIQSCAKPKEFNAPSDHVIVFPTTLAGVG